ncbi:3'(2'),5'-bisphosphate nucleotidase 1-like [Teleopsis dalmanni]|uniref:3'(2'),5'-bisphosphate nucleotidase 1-like n=1 Tax=Teleopsis dalmanni TaxID=139649 RepID=UPI0018CD81D4|nr:3'(2'),5'-bisphosphate nucleotidase 1-like [Teleopsis dalmanni]
MFVLSNLYTARLMRSAATVSKTIQTEKVNFRKVQSNHNIYFKNYCNCNKMTVPTIMRVMALSITTANRAGTIIRDVMKKGNLNIVEKGKDDLQTEADRSAQRCIIASLTKEFPNIKIIGEEGGSDLNVKDDWLVKESDAEFLKQNCPEELQEIKDEDFVIWVDPLDGTSEYTQGFLDHVTVLIGVAIKNCAVGGVIHQPYYENDGGMLGRTIWGLKGLGIGGFVPSYPPDNKLIITTTRSHFSPSVQAALDALAPNEVIKVGGAGFKVLQLLEGKAHAYVFPNPGCKKWDTCAPEAVLEANGGTLTDMLGDHYSYNACIEFPNKRGVLATNGKIDHCEILKKIPESVLEVMRK